MAAYAVGGSGPGGTAGGSGMAGRVDEQAVEMIKEKPQQHIEHSFAVDTSGPEKNGRQPKDGCGSQGIVRKMAAEDAEESDIADEDRKGKKKGVDVHVVLRQQVEEHLDEDDPIVRYIGPGRIIGKEQVNFRQQAVAVQEAE